MSLDIERGGRDPGGSPGLEDFVAREHWQPIAANATLQAVGLGLIVTLMSVPAPVAFSLIYVVTLVGAMFTGLIAPRVAVNDPESGVHIARRCLASLVVSGLSLMAFTLTFDGTLPTAAMESTPVAAP